MCFSLGHSLFYSATHALWFVNLERDFKCPQCTAHQSCVAYCPCLAPIRQWVAMLYRLSYWWNREGWRTQLQWTKAFSCIIRFLEGETKNVKYIANSDQSIKVVCYDQRRRPWSRWFRAHHIHCTLLLRSSMTCWVPMSFESMGNWQNIGCWLSALVQGLCSCKWMQVAISISLIVNGKHWWFLIYRVVDCRYLDVCKEFN